MRQAAWKRPCACLDCINTYTWVFLSRAQLVGAKRLSRSLVSTYCLTGEATGCTAVRQRGWDGVQCSSQAQEVYRSLYSKMLLWWKLYFARKDFSVMPLYPNYVFHLFIHFLIWKQRNKMKHSRITFQKQNKKMDFDLEKRPVHLWLNQQKYRAKPIRITLYFLLRYLKTNRGNDQTSMWLPSHTNRKRQFVPGLIFKMFYFKTKHMCVFVWFWK